MNSPMTLHLYNSLSREKEAFQPIDPANVRMYVCGPTVYDYVHIGNARPVVVFDLLFRVLRHIYGADHVTYARNITDIEDKIIDRALASGREIGEITRETTLQYQQDMAAIGALTPSIEPRATDHLGAMITMIEKLIAGGHAYEAEGHVLFRVKSDAAYGHLSRQSMDDMIAGARVEVAPYKEDAADFVLWKPSDDETPGWDSPWGRGRPGWHIECSAMSEAHLGETFDIHGGGIDLIFPHHENEIAQSACSHGGAPLANYWMHNGFITVEGEKMSKSEGNFYTVHDLLAERRGEVLRYTMLASHYRQPLDWTVLGMDQARQSLDSLYTALRGLSDVEASVESVPEAVLAALSDDLNTPMALTVLHELAGQANRASSDEEKRQIKSALLFGGRLMGLLEADPNDWFHQVVRVAGVSATGAVGDVKVVVLTEAEVQAYIDERNLAKANKNFEEADRIRDELADNGIILEDGPDGTSWKRA